MAKNSLVNEILGEALRVGAKAAARAFDSVLEDGASALAGAEARVNKARRVLLKKVKESLEAFESEPENDD